MQYAIWNLIRILAIYANHFRIIPISLAIFSFKYNHIQKSHINFVNKHY